MMIESIHEYERVQRERAEQAEREHADAIDISFYVNEAVAAAFFLSACGAIVLLCVGLS